MSKNASRAFRIRRAVMRAKIRAAAGRNGGSIFSPAVRLLPIIREMIREGQLEPTNEYRKPKGSPLMRRYRLVTP